VFYFETILVIEKVNRYGFNKAHVIGYRAS